MEARYHRQILEQAIGERLGATAFERVFQANVGQDRWSGLLFHLEYHFDNSLFAQSEAYMASQHEQAVAALRAGNYGSVLEAYGHLSHAVQDFFAHSNYVDLWLASHGGLAGARPNEIEPPARYGDSPGLYSGTASMIPFLLSRLPLIGLWLLPWVCAPNHHERMNLDHPGRGPKFPFAFAAAVKATRRHYEVLLDAVAPSDRERFEVWAESGA